MIRVSKLRKGNPGQWYGDCSECPSANGFMTHPVFQLVLMWAVSHADKHRHNRLNVELYSR